MRPRYAPSRVLVRRGALVSWLEAEGISENCVRKLIEGGIFRKKVLPGQTRGFFVVADVVEILQGMDSEEKL